MQLGRWMSEWVCVRTSCKKTLVRVSRLLQSVRLHSPHQMATVACWLSSQLGLLLETLSLFSWISESLGLTFQSCYMIIGIQFLCGLKHLSFLLSADIRLLMTLKGFLSFWVAWITFFFYFIKIVVYFKQKSSSTTLLRHYNDFSHFWIYLCTELFLIAEIMMPLHSLIVAATVQGEVRKRRVLGDGHTLIRRSAVNRYY